MDGPADRAARASSAELVLPSSSSRESVAVTPQQQQQQPGVWCSGDGGGVAKTAVPYSVCSAAFLCPTASCCAEPEEGAGGLRWQWWERLFCFQWSSSVYHNALSMFFWTGMSGCVLNSENTSHFEDRMSPAFGKTLHHSLTCAQVGRTGIFGI